MYRHLTDSAVISVISKEMHLIHYQVDYINKGYFDFLLPIEVISDGAYSYSLKHHVGEKMTLVEFLEDSKVEFSNFILGISQLLSGLIRLEETLLGANGIVLAIDSFYFECCDNKTKVSLAFLPIKARENTYEAGMRQQSKLAIINTILLAKNSLVGGERGHMSDLLEYCGTSPLDFKGLHALCESWTEGYPYKIEEAVDQNHTLIEKKEKKEKRNKKEGKKKTHKRINEICVYIKYIRENKKKKREIVFAHSICLSLLLVAMGVLMSCGFRNMKTYLLAVIVCLLIQGVMLMNKIEGHTQQLKKRTIEIDSNTVYISKDYI